LFPFGQLVFDFGRDFGVHDAQEQAVGLQLAKPLRRNFLGLACDLAFEITQSADPAAEPANEDFPLPSPLQRFERPLNGKRRLEKGAAPNAWKCPLRKRCAY
jgi:hypothetical protein